MTPPGQRADTVGIVGAGSFGTALGYVLATAGRRVVLWSRDPAVVAAIATTRICPRLHTPPLPALLTATADPRVLAEAARFIVMAVPSTQVADRARELGAHLDGSHIVVHAVGALPRSRAEAASEHRALARGRVSEVIGQGVPTLKIGALAGPALPADLVHGEFASLVVASRYNEVVVEARRLLHTPPQLRVYSSKDLVGVELASALAGAYTVALGLCDGLDVGTGPRAVLITRAIAEASRLSMAAGAEARTFSGLAGLGNLLVRSSDQTPQSQATAAQHGIAGATDRSDDYQLGRQLALGGAFDGAASHTEGARAAAAALELAGKLRVAMPILAAVAAVLSRQISPRDAVRALSDTATIDE